MTGPYTELVELRRNAENQILPIDQQPGINPALITDYYNKGELNNLIALFDFMRRSLARSEGLTNAYFRQMEVYLRTIQEMRADASGTDAHIPRRPRPVDTNTNVNVATNTESVTEPARRSVSRIKGTVVAIDL